MKVTECTTLEFLEIKQNVKISEALQNRCLTRFFVTYQQYQLASPYAQFSSTAAGTTQSPSTVSVSRAESATTDVDRRTSPLCCSKHQRTQQEQGHQNLCHFLRKILQTVTWKEQRRSIVLVQEQGFERHDLEEVQNCASRLSPKTWIF